MKPSRNRLQRGQEPASNCDFSVINKHQAVNTIAKILKL